MATIDHRCQSQTINIAHNMPLCFEVDGLMIDSDWIWCEGMRQGDTSLA
jgi:hypothetical protein